MQLDSARAVETPEGIALTLRPAGPSVRFVAFLVDQLIRGALFLLCAMVAGFLGAMGGAFFLIVFFAIEWIYPIAFELSMSGATPGKRVMGLQVVMDSGLPVTPAGSIARNLLRTADFLPAFYALGGVCVLLRPDFKRLGDLAAGTIVVHARTVNLHGKVPDVDPVRPSRALTLPEQAAVVAWAGRSATLTGERFDELAQLARSAVPEDVVRDGRPLSSALLGVAHWILGHREERRP
jgi:uncharacterized RDD family membrane protein YckC